jgi:glycosyltransferase involved in cell wall biosynthesis
VNGVVRTLDTVAGLLRERGLVVEVIGPDRFRTVPMPGYASIRLAVLPARKLARLVDEFGPDALHIATEGPLGLAARRIALARGWRFTTSFHTRFAEYLHARTRMPLALSYAWLRWFHAPSAGTLVATPSLRDELATRGLRNLRPWTRGVDLARFQPEPREDWPFPRPVFLNVGRVAVEKNLAAFLALDLPGSKVVVGDGPQRAALQRRFPAAHFVGERHGEALSRAYAGADAFVFPSRTDTFGLVLLESLACGTPVAAFPVTGPKDVLAGAATGALGEDLRAAALRALAADRAACRAYAERFSWAVCADRFVSSLVPVGPLSHEAQRHVIPRTSEAVPRKL